MFPGTENQGERKGTPRGKAKAFVRNLLEKGSCGIGNFGKLDHLERGAVYYNLKNYQRGYAL